MSFRNILIKNSRIITENKILDGYSLVIQDGIIKQVTNINNDDERGFMVIDAKGQYLSPGFLDIHNHGNSGADTMDANAEAIGAMSRFHLSKGVTGFLATTMTNSHKNTVNAIKNAVACIENCSCNGAQLLGLYLEGPYFCLEKKGAQPPADIKNPDLEEMREFIELGKDFIKVVALAPELKGAIEVISLLKSKRITVSAGHSNADFEQTMNGINCGVTEATHIYNGMRAFTHRDPGIIGACLLDDRVFCEMICDGIHIHPSAMEMAVRLKGKDKIILISDAMRATGLKDGEYDLGGQMVIVKNHVAMLSDGTLAGSTLTLDRAVCNIVRLVGVPLIDAVKMASLNPAKSIGIEARKGSIAVGKDADLILFDENIQITRVWIGGKEKI